MQSGSITAASAIDYPADDDICKLLGSLTLKGWSETVEQIPTIATEPKAQLAAPVDVPAESSPGTPNLMEVTDNCGNIQFVARPLPDDAPCGCGILASLRTALEWRTGSTSPPDFLDAILTHREAFVVFPAGHRTCSMALTRLAFALERRAAETLSDGDLDTAIALHNEAWLVSGWS